jgi:predicted permease
MFTAISLLTLAIGIGANTAMFTIIEGVLLKPLPYPQPDQLVALWHKAPGVNIDNLNLSPSLYFIYSEESRVFQDVGMWTDRRASITGLAEPEEVPSMLVTNRLLPLLDVRPVLGRVFTATDDRPKNERTVMLSYGYWQSRFGGSPSVLGRRILIDGEAAEVIGVLPATFRFMDRKPSVVMPLRFDRTEVRLGNFSFQGVARLKPGVTLSQATADVARMLPLAQTKFPAPGGFSVKMFEDARIAPNLRSLKDDLLGNVGNMLWVVMGTVGMVLLIACANVANLLLVRAEGRQQELAVRAALGAGWGRIARELLLESVLLGISGGMLGLTLAYGALQVLTAADVSRLPRIDSVAIDPWVLLFTLGISLTAGLVFGLIPVFKYVRPQLANALRGGGRSASQSRDRHRTRSILVVVQVALALVLLVSSGLMIRSVVALRNVDPGFSQPGTVQTVSISIPSVQVKEQERVLRMEEAILRKIGTIAGVSAVAGTNALPMENGSNDPIYVEGRFYREGSIPPIRRYKHVSPGYFSTVGTRMVAGRDVTWQETYSQARVALISENFAREIWQDPRLAVGKRIRATFKDDWREVIGVVADLRDNGIDQKAPTIVYWPLWMKNFEGQESRIERSISYVIRTPRADSTAFLSEVRQAIWSVNPNLPLANVRTLQTIQERSLARTSLTMVLLSIAGAMALLLGVVGIYGVISYSVSQRTREIGIRLALGAPLAEVTRMFVRHGLVLSGIGAACGLAAAFALTRVMSSLLYDVSPADPVTYLAVSAGLIFAAFLASYLPARRATQVDPINALRAE